MTLTKLRKRLNEIETELTPKEWARQVIGEIREYPSDVDCMKAWDKLPLSQHPLDKPYRALEKMAGRRYPGRRPKDVRVRLELTRKLWTDFSFLLHLPLVVSRKVEQEAWNAGTLAALRLSELHSLLVQDLHGSGAAKAAAWIEAHPPANGEDEGAWQALLTELAELGRAGAGVTTAGPPSRVGFPPWFEWAGETAVLLTNFYAHRAAVQRIQNDHFDGQPILLPQVEALMAQTARLIENGIAAFNAYRERRMAGVDPTGLPPGCALAGSLSMESIRADAEIGWADTLVKEWLAQAQLDAEASDRKQMEHLQRQLEAADPKKPSSDLPQTVIA